MRLQMKPSSFRVWRKRTAGRVIKLAALRNPYVLAAVCAPTLEERTLIWFEQDLRMHVQLELKNVA